jgi:hypothetical protein
MKDTNMSFESVFVSFQIQIRIRSSDINADPDPDPDNESTKDEIIFTFLLFHKSIFSKLKRNYNYLLTYDSYGPVYNRFHRGKWITWASGGRGPWTLLGPLPLAHVIHSPL